MELKGQWQRELTKRILADENLHYQDRNNRAQHTNAVFEHAFEYAYKAFTLAYSKRYRQIWLGENPPEWLVTDRDIKTLEEDLIADFEYLNELSVRYKLGALVGYAALLKNNPTGERDIDTDVMRSMCDGYIQSLYDYANGVEEPVDFGQDKTLADEPAPKPQDAQEVQDAANVPANTPANAPAVADEQQIPAESASENTASTPDDADHKAKQTESAPVPEPPSNAETDNAHASDTDDAATSSENVDNQNSSEPAQTDEPVPETKESETEPEAPNNNSEQIQTDSDETQAPSQSSPSACANTYTKPNVIPIFQIDTIPEKNQAVQPDNNANTENQDAYHEFDMEDDDDAPYYEDAKPDGVNSDNADSES